MRTTAPESGAPQVLAASRPVIAARSLTSQGANREATPAAGQTSTRQASAAAGEARFSHEFSHVPVHPPARAAPMTEPSRRLHLIRERYHVTTAIPRVAQSDAMSAARGPDPTSEPAPVLVPTTPASGNITTPPEEGKTVTFAYLPPIALPATSDAIASHLTYQPAIDPVAPPATPTKFGQADARIAVNRSSATHERGTFRVELIIDNIITYWVAGGTRTDIASDADPDITQAAYPQVVSDLTPSLTAVKTADLDLYKNQPPRKKYWARDLTIKHEKFHADEDVKFGRKGALDAQAWFDRQTAASFDEVGTLLGRVSQMVARRIISEMAPPGVEQRAYDAGAADYRARAQAIKTRGDARGYQATQSPAPKTTPRPPSPRPQSPQSK